MQKLHQWRDIVNYYFFKVFFFSFWFFSTEDENLPSNFPQYMHVKNVWTLLSKISHFWGPWLSNPMLTNMDIFPPNLLMWTNLSNHLFYWLASSTDRPRNTCWNVSFYRLLSWRGVLNTTLCDSLSVTCGRSVGFFMYSVFLHPVLFFYFFYWMVINLVFVDNKL